MNFQEQVLKRPTERMSNVGFRLMSLTFDLVDLVHPYIDRRVTTFGIREGMTVVDYGCGPGRYTTRLARLVGERGQVYAVDIHELAIEAVKDKIAKLDLRNVQPMLAHGYDCGLPDHVADVVCALDMFFGIKQRVTRRTNLQICPTRRQKFGGYGISKHYNGQTRLFTVPSSTKCAPDTSRSTSD